MNEGLSAKHEGRPGGKDPSFEEFSNRLEALLGSLDEALEESPLVTTPDGRTLPAVGESERALAKAQLFRDAVRGEVEAMRAQNDLHGEEAAALSEEAFDHLTRYLSVITDLNNLADMGVPQARTLAKTIGTIALLLLPSDSTHAH